MRNRFRFEHFPRVYYCGPLSESVGDMSCRLWTLVGMKMGDMVRDAHDARGSWSEQTPSRATRLSDARFGREGISSLRGQHKSMINSLVISINLNDVVYYCS